MQKYNWTRAKLEVVTKTCTIFYYKFNDSFSDFGISLEDFKQDILYKLLSVSGYKTCSMKLYKDTDVSLRGFTYLICRHYLKNAKDKFMTRVNANFTVSYLEDVFNEEINFYSFSDCIEGKADTTYDFNRLVEIAPNIPVNRFTDLTFKQLLLELVSKTTNTISQERKIPLPVVNKCKKELENYLRGAYV